MVVGGTAITGGRGSILGTLIGVALLGTIGTALTFIGINPFWEKAIQAQSSWRRLCLTWLSIVFPNLALEILDCGPRPNSEPNRVECRFTNRRSPADAIVP